MVNKRKEVVEYFVLNEKIINMVNHPDFYLKLSKENVLYILTFSEDKDILLVEEETGNEQDYCFDEFFDIISEFKLEDYEENYSLSIDLDISPCGMCDTVNKFTINGINADIYDFGITTDLNKDKAPLYGCGYHTFIKNDFVTDKLLLKYAITNLDVTVICDEIYKQILRKKCDFCR